MKAKKSLKVILVIIVLTVTLGGAYYAYQQKVSKSKRTVENFQQIEKGDTVKVLEDIVGSMDKNVGSGLDVYVYEMSDGSDMLVTINPDKEKDQGTVLSITQVYEDDSELIILE